MRSNKNNFLVIITYDMNRGAWLENEIVHHYKKDYKKIFVINTCPDIYLGGNISNYSECSVLTYTMPMMLGAVAKSLGKKVFWEEIKLLIKARKATWNNMKRALNYMAASMVYAKRVDEILEKNGVLPSDNVVFYAYWMSVQAECLLHLKTKYYNSKFITRCHRVDIYEEEQKDGYLEYRKSLLELMDRIYCISEHGKKYLEERYGYSEKIDLAFLGSIKRQHQLSKVKKNGKEFKIVSCSTITPVKRVDFIATVLSKISDIPIIWHHYGDGPLMEKVVETVKELPKNITCELEGNIPHEELLDKYEMEKYDLFVMASTSEGIPVSIMEALEMGIPVIATDVGGVKEIVYDGINGILLKENASIEDYISAIRKIAFLDDKKYESMVEQCKKIWLEKYDAIANFSKFADEVRLLIEK